MTFSYCKLPHLCWGPHTTDGSPASAELQCLGYQTSHAAVHEDRPLIYSSVEIVDGNLHP